MQMGKKQPHVHKVLLDHHMVRWGETENLGCELFDRERFWDKCESDSNIHVLGVCPMSIVSCLSWPNTNLYFLLLILKSQSIILFQPKN